MGDVAEAAANITPAKNTKRTISTITRLVAPHKQTKVSETILSLKYLL